MKRTIEALQLVLEVLRLEQRDVVVETLHRARLIGCEHVMRWTLLSDLLIPEGSGKHLLLLMHRQLGVRARQRVHNVRNGSPRRTLIAPEYGQLVANLSLALVGRLVWITAAYTCMLHT